MIRSSDFALQSVYKTVYKGIPLYTPFQYRFITDFREEVRCSNVENFHIRREEYMKKKENRVMSFRFEDHILNKVDWLVDKENEKLKGLGIKPKTRKQVIEEIIEKYYFDIINESRDPDVVNRISNMVKDQADIHYDALRKRLDEILFLVIKNDLGNKVLYDNSDLMPQTVNEQRAYEMINRKDCFWDEVLNSYMAERKGRIYADLGMIWRSKL